MCFLQEELDWTTYVLYGFVPRIGGFLVEPECYGEISPTTRPFEWIDDNTPPEIALNLRRVFENRKRAAKTNKLVRLLEDRNFKRPWLGRQGVYGSGTTTYKERGTQALREWLLNRLEGYFFGGERMLIAAPRQSAANPSSEGDSTGGLPTAATQDGLAAIRAHWPAGQQPALVSTNQLAAVVETDADFLRVAEIYSGGPGFSVSKLVRELVEAESVPFLPFQRYKDTGLRKRQDWEHVWELQREEDKFDAQIDPLKKELEDLVKRLSKDGDAPDAPKWEARKGAVGDQIRVLNEDKAREIGTIPVPPKYTSGDFKKSHWWKLCGKLDVPKERWIVYPGAERDGDPSPVIAWAGWDHLQQAKALASYYVDASTNLGWTSEKLQPLLAGVADLVPWLKQWHNDFDPEVTSGLGDYFAGFLDEEARKQGTTVETLNQLRLGGIV